MKKRTLRKVRFFAQGCIDGNWDKLSCENSMLSHKLSVLTIPSNITSLWGKLEKRWSIQFTVRRKTAKGHIVTSIWQLEWVGPGPILTSSDLSTQGLIWNWGRGRASNGGHRWQACLHPCERIPYCHLESRCPISQERRSAPGREAVLTAAWFPKDAP